MPRTFTLVSIVIHAAAIACVLIAQAIDVGRLPIPREALAFTERRVQISDIVPPPSFSHERSRVGPSQLTSIEPAPLEPPPDVTPENGRGHGGNSTGPATGATTGEENSANGLAAVDTIPGATTVPAPLPPSSQPVRLHPGIQAPRKIIDVSPLYPPQARAARLEGVP